MCNFQQIIRPNDKLQKMLGFVKIILIMNFLNAILRIFVNPMDILYDLFCALFLMMAYKSVFYIYMAIYIIFSLLNSFFLFISCGMFFQILIQGNSEDFKINFPLVLSISLYLFVFYIFSIIYNFSVYKEMRAQAMEFTGEQGQSDMERPRANNPSESNQPQATDQTNPSFRPFSGQGRRIGGN